MSDNSCIRHENCLFQESYRNLKGAANYWQPLTIFDLDPVSITEEFLVENLYSV